MSRRRLFSALLLWGGLPLAVGIGAYLWPVAGEADGSGARRSSAVSQRSATGQRTDVAAAIAEAHAAIDATWAAELARRFPAPPDAGSLDTAALRELLTKLQGECPDPHSIEGDDLEISRYLWEQQEPLLRELIAREGGAAADWIDDYLPGLSYAAMYRLADHDPEAALEHLAHLHKNTICDESTLFKIFSSKVASGGGEALRAAVEQIPWHLCHPSNFITYYELPKETTGEEVGCWATSGAALHLAQQGVELRGVFRLLGQTNPSLAVSTWSEWSEAVPAESDKAFLELLRSPKSEQSDARYALSEAFARSDDATRAKLVAALDRVAASPDTDYMRDYRIYRELHALSGDQSASPGSEQKADAPNGDGEESSNTPTEDK